jgi:uncharacterized repeat protein (TIGR01451 family)
MRVVSLVMFAGFLAVALFVVLTFVLAQNAPLSAQTVPIADTPIVIAISDGLTVTAPGARVTYTLHITNTGAITANFVRPSDGIAVGTYWLVDTPPAGSAILDFSPDGTTGSGFSLDPLRPDQVAWSFKLAPFATAVQTLTVQIPAYPCAAAITNTVVMQYMGYGGYQRVEDVNMLDPMQCAGYMPMILRW